MNLGVSLGMIDDRLTNLTQKEQLHEERLRQQIWKTC